MDDIRQMIDTIYDIRYGELINESTNFEEPNEKPIVVTKETPQFNLIRTQQEDDVRKAIHDSITFEKDALKFYPEKGDLILTGRLTYLDLLFKFRLYGASGPSCYIWASSLQLTENTARTINEVHNAFENWKDSITADAELIERLKKEAKRNNG